MFKNNLVISVAVAVFSAISVVASFLATTLVLKDSIYYISIPAIIVMMILVFILVSFQKKSNNIVKSVLGAFFMLVAMTTIVIFITIMVILFFGSSSGHWIAVGLNMGVLAFVNITCLVLVDGYYNPSPTDPPQTLLIEKKSP